MCVWSHLKYPEREVVSPRCLHHLEELRLASCTKCFLRLHNPQFQTKAHGRFSPVTRWNSCKHHYTSGYPGRMNLAHCKKAIETFSKGMRWRTHPPHHKYHRCYCFLCDWAIDTPHEQVTGILPIMSSCVNNTGSSLHSETLTHSWTGYD